MLVIALHCTTYTDSARNWAWWSFKRLSLLETLATSGDSPALHDICCDSWHFFPSLFSLPNSRGIHPPFNPSPSLPPHLPSCNEVVNPPLISWQRFAIRSVTHGHAVHSEILTIRSDQVLLILFSLKTQQVVWIGVRKLYPHGRHCMCVCVCVEGGNKDVTGGDVACVEQF